MVVTATSATGTCQGPTIWSRAVKPPTAAIADGDEETCFGDRRHAQHAYAASFRSSRRRPAAVHLPPPRVTVQHFRRLAQQHVHRHVDRLVAEVRIFDRELAIVGGDAEHGEGTALALAQGAEFVEALRRDGQHVALLRSLHQISRGLMPGSSLGIARRSKARPPAPCASSGSALERPPAPTSWMARIGLRRPSASSGR
jgi:hypothetical protein